MAPLCNLLILPGELRNEIYDSVLALEGITIINARTGLHSLGRTCRQLNTELTSHTNGRAADAAIPVHATIFDLDFSHVETWLESNPSLPGKIRRLALNVVILSSASRIGLPYENEDEGGSPRSMLAISDGRLIRMYFNVRACVNRRWKFCEYDPGSETSSHYVTSEVSPRLTCFRLETKETAAQYIGTLALHMQETIRCSPSWPKPRNDSVKRFVANSRGSLRAAVHDYAHGLRRLLHTLSSRDWSICGLLTKAMDKYMQSTIYTCLAPVIPQTRPLCKERPSMFSEWRKATEESYRVYDASVMRIVTAWGAIEGQKARQSRALKQASYSLGCKREAEDDQHASRKARCLTIDGRATKAVVRELAREVDGTLGWDIERMVESFGELALN
ncbi:hypothetical protein B0A48_10445 [Cryoendolithus antarcticus]|uniref:Uncharacterized protein n=1 Tax=Cryoendolithus antarcticus TaxID=1507870 RepID=A0A1V8SXC3_9PEZI|nr:hypothetical protein B0A48_10445 [Cryoendolithus antarcticus]